MSVIPRLPTIVCAICNKPVDRVEVVPDFANDGTIWRVHCHGDKDTCEVPRHVDLSREALVTAVAFQTKRIA